MRNRDSNLRVLVVAGDRRFRTVTSALLAQRGCSVSIHDGSCEIPQSAARERADVVVLDATRSLTAAALTAGQLRSLRPPVGVVAVSSDPLEQLPTLPVLPKWGSFDALFGAVQRMRGQDADV